MHDAYEDATWCLAHQQHAPAGPRLIALCREISRRHHPAEGLAESVLWALAARGFELPPSPDSDEDVFGPLRRCSRKDTW